MADELQSNKIMMPRNMSGARFLYGCPIDDCDWTYDPDAQPPMPLAVLLDTDPTGGESTFAGLAAAIGRAATERAKRDEDNLRAHFDDHDIVDFLRTINRLNQDLYNAGPTGVRPHAPERVGGAKLGPRSHVLPTSRAELAALFGDIRLPGTGAVATGHFVQLALDVLLAHGIPADDAPDFERFRLDRPVPGDTPPG